MDARGEEDAWDAMDGAERDRLLEALCFEVIEAAPDPNVEEATATPVDLAARLPEYPREIVERAVLSMGGQYLSAVAGRPVSVSIMDPATVYV
jgi:hypothetical protein